MSRDDVKQGLGQILEGMNMEELDALAQWLQNSKRLQAAEPQPKHRKEPSAAELHKREVAKAASLRVARKDSGGRLKKMKIHKEETPLKLAEYQFLGEQRARNNSEETIKGYARAFKKLYLFAAEMYGEVEGESLWNSDLPQEELVDIGSHFSISVLEADDLIEDFRSYIEADGSSEITANYYLRHIKAIINYFADEGVIDRRKIVISEDKPTIKDVYTDDELRKLLRRPANEDNFTECRDWAIIQTFMGTGCRVSTLTALRVGDIDFENGLIIMNKQKNKKPNVIPLQQANLAPTLREYIYAWRCDAEGNPLLNAQLFCRFDGEDTTVGAIKKAVASFNQSRGVSKTSCHLFRHTFAKRWILAGKSTIELKKILNHSSMKMVEHYANLWGNDIKDSLEDASLLSQVKKPTGKKLQKPSGNRLQRRR